MSDFDDEVKVMNRLLMIIGNVEALQPLIGNSRWSMDLIAFLTDDLFQLAKAVGDRIHDLDYIRAIG